MRRPAVMSATAVATVLWGCGSTTKTVTVTAPAPSTATIPLTTTTSAVNRSTPSAPTTTSAPPATVLHLGTFRSPTGNIGCVVIAGVARCDIKQRSWSPPPRPPDCPNVVDYGQGLEVGGSGAARLVCAGDTALNPSGQPLAYGADTVVGLFRCSSRTSGVTCIRTNTGHGFFISYASYRTF